jgi:hypothetical protein
MSRWFIVAGLILLVVGLLLHFAPWLFSWFGKLPGDIRIETERSKVYFPITSMILVSIGLTVLVNLVGVVIRFLSK